MAQTIKLKRSATAGNTPTTSQLSLGEIAINTTDGKLFIKRSVGGTESIVEVGSTGSFLPLSGGTLTGNLSLGDNVKAQFGASNDLQIFHTGSYSAIKDVGTGALFIGGDNYVDIGNSGLSQTRARFYDGTVQLHSGGEIKLATTSTGIDVVGKVSSDGLEVDLSSSGDAELTGAINSNAGLVVRDPTATAYGAHFSYDDANTVVSIGGKTNGTKNTAITIGRDSNDISFYDSSGNQGFFFDSSTSRLGLGTTVPSEKLHLQSSYVGSGSGEVAVRMTVPASSISAQNEIRSGVTGGTNPYMSFAVRETSAPYSTVEKLRINADGSSVFSGTLQSEKLIITQYGAPALKIIPDPAFSNEPEHDLIYTGYQSNLQDYLSIKAAGNSSTFHGVLAISDVGIYFGRTHVETGSPVGNSATSPFDASNYGYINNTGLTVNGTISSGAITSSGLTVSTASSVPTFDIITTHPSGIPILNLKGAASAQIRYQDENGNNQSRIDFNDAGAFNFINATDNSSHLVLNSSGNVNIPNGGLMVGSTTAPATNTKLHIKTSANQNIEFEETGSKLRISALNDARSANVPLQFASSGYEFLTGNATFSGSVSAGGLKIDGGTLSHASSNASSITISGGSNSTNGMNVSLGGSSGSLSQACVWKQNSSEVLRLDSSANLGLGCTPSAHAFSKAIQIGDGAVWTVSGNQNSTFASNAYLASNGSFKYIAANKASKINLYNGGFTVATTNTSGSADGDITFTDRLIINSSGNATFSGTVTGGNGAFSNLTINATEKLRFDGFGGHTFIQESSNDTLTFATGGSTRLTLDANATFSGSVTAPTLQTSSGNIVITGQEIYSNSEYSGNDGAVRINRFGYQGGQTKFRDVNIYDGKGTSILTVDGSTGNTNIPNGSLMVGSTTAPDTALHVESANDTVGIFESTDATSKIQFKDNSSTYGASIGTTDENFFIQANGGTRLTINSSGNATFSGNVSAGTVAQVFTSSDRGYFVAGTSDSSNQHLYLGSYHGSTLKQLTFSGSNNALYPQTTASIDLGLTAYKFKNLYLSGTISSGSITSSGAINGTYFSDGYIQWTAAQLNRYGAAIELQFAPTNAATLVKIGANGSNPTTFNAYTGAATFSGTISSGAITSTGLTVNGAGTFKNNSNENLFLADTANTARSSLQVSGAVTYFNANIDTALHGQFVWRSSNAYTERLRIDNQGRVGINTSSPDAIIETSASATGNTVGALLTNTNGSGTADSVSLNFGLGRSADGFIRSVPAIKLLKEQQWTGTPSTVDCALVFSTVSNETSAERMRLNADGSCRWTPDGTTHDMTLTADGNLLVGTTDPFPGGGDTNTGVSLHNTGAVTASRDGDFAGRFNRKTSDGDIVQFNKDGTTVGSIGTLSGTMYIGNGDCNLLLTGATDQMLPVGTAGATKSGQIDLGSSGNRFKDLYLSGNLRADTGNAYFGAHISPHGDNAYINMLGSNRIQFLTNGSEAARIDASQNLLVGTTSSVSTSSSQTGAEMRANGIVVGAVNGNVSFIGNRIGSDGDIALFRRDGSTAGSIGVNSTTPYMSGNLGGFRLTSSAGAGVMIPTDTSGNASDADNDLGVSSIRWRDLYLSNAVKNSSGALAVESGGGGQLLLKASSELTFTSNTAERGRFDTSGNLLVGKTSADTYNNTNGVELQASGLITATRTGIAQILNREDSDGDIAVFRRDGVTKGNISVSAYGMGFGGGTRSSDFFIKTDGTASFAETVSAPSVGKNKIGLQFVTTNESYGIGAIQPYSISGTTNSDAKISLGNTSNARFDDICAMNGTIQTSDRNEKQDIESLTEAEERVAVVAKGLFKKFRWKSAVQDKGDDARIHFGIIAQDLQAAFEAEGLDAGRYGMFTSDTWTEDGVEKTRMGVRYSELLAFIISAI